MDDDRARALLRRLVEGSGYPGFLLTEYATPEDWRDAQHLEDAGLVEVGRRFYTMCTRYMLTDRGRALLA
jgi:hypothetical protein